MRIGRARLAIVTALVAALALPAPAYAGTAHGRRQVVAVSIAGGAISDPNPAAAPSGQITFKVTTPDAGGHNLQLIRVKPGGTLQRFIDGTLGALSNDPATAAAGVRTAMGAADFLGGAAVYQQTRPVSFTARLGPGTYHLLDYFLLGAPDPAATVRTFTVTRGHGGAVTRPRVNAVIGARETGEGRMAWVTAPRLPAHLNALVRNPTGQPIETLFARLTPGTTDADVQAYFDWLAGGSVPPAPANPFIAPPPGLMPIGPGRSAVVHVDLQPGTYVLLSFVHSPVTGVGGAFTGLHKVITVG